MKHFRNSLGINLQQVLGQRGMRQCELAEQTGISNSAISSYVQGMRMPKEDNLRKMCKILNVPLERMMVGMDDYMTCNGCKFKGDTERKSPCKVCRRYYSDFWEGE